MRYILFDIDGTLTAGGEGGGAGSAALNLAFEELFSIPDAFDTVQKAGKTDPIILREGFEINGVEITPERAERFQERYLHHLEEQLRVPGQRARVLSGVVRILDALAAGEREAVFGLLTGNWSRGARIKLASVVLDAYFSDNGAFDLGAFGEDAPTRPELVPVAWKRFRTKTRREIAACETIIVGDTPRDVECAHINGARAVAVETGPFGADDLKEADLLLPDLSDAERVLSYLLD